MRQKYGILNKKYHFFLGGGTAPTQTLPQWVWGIPFPTPHPPRCLRPLDPSHSKILCLPLTK